MQSKKKRYQTTWINFSPLGQLIPHKPDLKIHFYSSYNNSKTEGIAAAKQPLDSSMMMSNHLTNCPFTYVKLSKHTSCKLQCMNIYG
jgi:hypothetical protein